MTSTAMDLDGPSEAPIAPPKLYHAREAYYEGFIEPQPDGYQKARSRGAENAAIVIDNGSHPSAILSDQL